MSSLPIVNATEFDVSDMEWTSVGFPTLAFELTYCGSQIFVCCHYEAYVADKMLSSGNLTGSFSKDLATRTFIVFPLGTGYITRLTLVPA